MGSKLRLCPVDIDFKTFADASWLSCTDACNKVIRLDYRVVQLPEKLQDYIIAHAYAHFYEPNHTKAFWSVLSQICPNYKECNEDLENYLFLKEL
jgi:predicted metal-dependent hydrolase